MKKKTAPISSSIAKPTNILLAGLIYVASIAIVSYLFSKELIEGVSYILIGSIIIFIGSVWLSTLVIGKVKSQSAKYSLIIFLSLIFVLIGFIASLGLAWAFSSI